MGLKDGKVLQLSKVSSVHCFGLDDAVCVGVCICVCVCHVCVFLCVVCPICVRSCVNIADTGCEKVLPVSRRTF